LTTAEWLLLAGVSVLLDAAGREFKEILAVAAIGVVLLFLFRHVLRTYWVDQLPDEGDRFGESDVRDPPSRPSRENSDELLRQATRRELDGDYDRALELYAEIEEQHAGTPAARDAKISRENLEELLRAANEQG